MATTEQWPGTVDEYRNALAVMDSTREQASADARHIAAAIVAGCAGLAQVLDKIAYAARKGGAR